MRSFIFIVFCLALYVSADFTKPLPMSSSAQRNQRETETKGNIEQKGRQQRQTQSTQQEQASVDQNQGAAGQGGKAGAGMGGQSRIQREAMEARGQSNFEQGGKGQLPARNQRDTQHGLKGGQQNIESGKQQGSRIQRETFQKGQTNLEQGGKQGSKIQRDVLHPELKSDSNIRDQGKESRIHRAVQQGQSNFEQQGKQQGQMRNQREAFEKGQSNLEQGKERNQRETKIGGSEGQSNVEQQYGKQLGRLEREALTGSQTRGEYGMESKKNQKRETVGRNLSTEEEENKKRQEREAEEKMGRSNVEGNVKGQISRGERDVLRGQSSFEEGKGKGQVSRSQRDILRGGQSSFEEGKGGLRGQRHSAQQTRNQRNVQKGGSLGQQQ